MVSPIIPTPRTSRNTPVGRRTSSNYPPVPASTSQGGGSASFSSECSGSSELTALPQLVSPRDDKPPPANLVAPPASLLPPRGSGPALRRGSSSWESSREIRKNIEAPPGVPHSLPPTSFLSRGASTNSTGNNTGNNTNNNSASDSIQLAPATSSASSFRPSPLRERRPIGHVNTVGRGRSAGVRPADVPRRQPNPNDPLQNLLKSDATEEKKCHDSPKQRRRFASVSTAISLQNADPPPSDERRQPDRDLSQLSLISHRTDSLVCSGDVSSEDDDPPPGQGAGSPRRRAPAIRRRDKRGLFPDGSSLLRESRGSCLRGFCSHDPSPKAVPREEMRMIRCFAHCKKYHQLRQWLAHRLTGLCQIERVADAFSPQRVERCLLQSAQLCRTGIPVALISRNSEQNKRITDVDSSNCDTRCNPPRNISEITRNILHRKPIRHPEKFSVNLERNLMAIQNLSIACAAVERLSRTPVTCETHAGLLLKVYTILVPSGAFPALPGGREWKDIGFQSADPTTDFRGVGLLGLQNLLFLTTRYPQLSRKLYKESITPSGAYDLAIIGINVSSWLLGWILWRRVQWSHLRCWADSFEDASVPRIPLGLSREPPANFLEYFYNTGSERVAIGTFGYLFVLTLIRFHYMWKAEAPPSMLHFPAVSARLLKTISFPPPSAARSIELQQTDESLADWENH